jgi:serine/threonine protein kinase
MAPEVIRGGQHTKQSDVYSFGLIVWQMLTKETPFADIPCLSTMYLIGNNKTPLIPEDCPVYFRNIMQSCWNTDPEKRPCFTDLIKTMKQIRNDIKVNPLFYN